MDSQPCKLSGHLIGFPYVECYNLIATRSFLNNAVRLHSSCYRRSLFLFHTNLKYPYDCLTYTAETWVVQSVSCVVEWYEQIECTDAYARDGGNMGKMRDLSEVGQNGPS